MSTPAHFEESKVADLTGIRGEAERRAREQLPSPWFEVGLNLAMIALKAPGNAIPVMGTYSEMPIGVGQAAVGLHFDQRRELELQTALQGSQLREAELSSLAAGLFTGVERGLEEAARKLAPEVGGVVQLQSQQTATVQDRDDYESLNKTGDPSIQITRGHPMSMEDAAKINPDQAKPAEHKVLTGAVAVAKVLTGVQDEDGLVAVSHGATGISARITEAAGTAGEIGLNATRSQREVSAVNEAERTQEAVLNEALRVLNPTMKSISALNTLLTPAPESGQPVRPFKPGEAGPGGIQTEPPIAARSHDDISSTARQQAKEHQEPARSKGLAPDAVGLVPIPGASTVSAGLEAGNFVMDQKAAWSRERQILAGSKGSIGAAAWIASTATQVDTAAKQDIRHLSDASGRNLQHEITEQRLHEAGEAAHKRQFDRKKTRDQAFEVNPSALQRAPQHAPQPRQVGPGAPSDRSS